jgi:hypothetical protein
VFVGSGVGVRVGIMGLGVAVGVDVLGRGERSISGIAIVFVGSGIVGCGVGLAVGVAVGDSVGGKVGVGERVVVAVAVVVGVRVAVSMVPGPSTPAAQEVTTVIKDRRPTTASTVAIGYLVWSLRKPLTLSIAVAWEGYTAFGSPVVCTTLSVCSASGSPSSALCISAIL